MRLPNVLVFILGIGVMMCLTPQSSHAQAVAGGEGGNLGIGVLFGEPTGVSLKYWNSNRSAFDVGAAWSLSGENEALHMHADLLFHSWLEGVETGTLAFYYGIGGRVIFADDPNVGARLPLGLNYVVPTLPFDFFVEAVPILDLAPDTEFAGNGALGLRYYF